MRIKPGSLVFGALLAVSAPAVAQVDSEHARKTYEIYEHIVNIESSKGLGNVPPIARYLADQMIDAGIPADDIEVVLEEPLSRPSPELLSSLLRPRSSECSSSDELESSSSDELE